MSTSTTDSICLSHNVFVCFRQSVSITDSLWLSETICFCLNHSSWSFLAGILTYLCRISVHRDKVLNWDSQKYCLHQGFLFFFRLKLFRHCGAHNTHFVGLWCSAGSVQGYCVVCSTSRNVQCEACGVTVQCVVLLCTVRCVVCSFTVQWSLYIVQCPASSQCLIPGDRAAPLLTNTHTQHSTLEKQIGDTVTQGESFPLRSVPIFFLLDSFFETQTSWSSKFNKQDRVGPVDNRPSTDKLHHFVL